MCKYPPTPQKKSFELAMHTNHYENGVNYTCSYRKFTQLSHGTIRIDLSFIVFEESMIDYNNVIKNGIFILKLISIYRIYASIMRLFET